MSQNLEEHQSYVQVPAEMLSDEALEGLISEFVLREGTDYGHSEPSLDEKTAKVKKQLQNGKILIAFSVQQETTTLLTKDEFKRLEKSNASSNEENYQ